MKRLFAAVATIIAVTSFQTLSAPAGAQTQPTPTPAASVAPDASASPAATPPPQPTMPEGPMMGGPGRHLPRRAGGATPAPPVDPDANRVGISGVWELALQQTSGNVEYVHFKLDQKGTILTGQYLDSSGKKYPLTGSVDGKNVRVVVTMANGTALIFNGQQDSGTDMVGTLDTSKDMIGFTAEYRPKYKWIENLSPNPTGAMGGGMGTPGVPY